MDLVRDAVLGVEFEIDPRFARLDAAAEDGAGGNGDAGAAAVAAGQAELPTAHFIAARRSLLAMELMVQPPELWDTDRDALELSFRTLALI